MSSNNRGPYYPKGVYAGTILEAALSAAPNGTPEVAIRVRIEPEPGSELQSYERTLHLYVTDKTMAFLPEKLEALGFTGGSLRDVGQLAGGAGSFYCKHEVYQGEERERWDVSTGGGKPLEIRPVDAAETRRLDALFGAAKKAANKPVSAPRSAAKSNGAALPAGVYDDGPQDNDIPF